jgi:hypothetical protein
MGGVERYSFEYVLPNHALDKERSDENFDEEPTFKYYSHDCRQKTKWPEEYRHCGGLRVKTGFTGRTCGRYPKKHVPTTITAEISSDVTTDPKNGLRSPG